MNKRILLIVLTLSLVGFLAYSLYYIQHRPSDAKLQGVDIILKIQDGVEPFMDEQDVRSEMARRIHKLEGMPIDSIDVGEVERLLRENPLFSEVEIYITAGSQRMKVEVVQREAAFLVQTARESYYISKERGIIPMNPNYAVYVPIVTGELSEEMARTTIYDLVQTLKEDSYFANYFGQIHYDSKEGIILSPRVGNTPVMLGHNQNFKEMLHKYKVFTQEVFPRTGVNAYAYIKLAYKDQVVTRRRDWQDTTE